MDTYKITELETKFCEHIPDLISEGVLYVSLFFEIAIHLCPCGCGNQSVTPFDTDFNLDNGWDIKIDSDKVTFTPSILNNNCPNKAHYYITDGKIIKI